MVVATDVVEQNLNDLVADLRPVAPDRQDLLPTEVARHTTRFKATASHTHLSFEQGGGNHGSHPHMVHEFVSAIVEGRPLAETRRRPTLGGVERLEPDRST